MRPLSCFRSDNVSVIHIYDDRIFRCPAAFNRKRLILKYTSRLQKNAVSPDELCLVYFCERLPCSLRRHAVRTVVSIFTVHVECGRLRALFLKNSADCHVFIRHHEGRASSICIRKIDILRLPLNESLIRCRFIRSDRHCIAGKICFFIRSTAVYRNCSLDVGIVQLLESEDRDLHCRESAAVRRIVPVCKGEDHCMFSVFQTSLFINRSRRAGAACAEEIHVLDYCSVVNIHFRDRAVLCDPSDHGNSGSVELYSHRASHCVGVHLTVLIVIPVPFTVGYSRVIKRDAHPFFVRRFDRQSAKSKDKNTNTCKDQAEYFCILCFSLFHFLLLPGS